MLGLWRDRLCLVLTSLLTNAAQRRRIGDVELDADRANVLHRGTAGNSAARAVTCDLRLKPLWPLGAMRVQIPLRARAELDSFDPTRRTDRTGTGPDEVTSIDPDVREECELILRA
jgi:hypothetical protein